MENENKVLIIFKELLPYVLIIIFTLLFKRYVMSPIKVNRESMYNTLHDGDIMILNNFHYYFNDIKRFDIVVVKYKNELIIKRIIGLPGETIEYKNNKLYVNGKKVNDKYANGDTTNFRVEIPKGKYYVLGDNRPVSLDSRRFGAFDKNKIIGKTKLIIFPFNRMGIKE